MFLTDPILFLQQFSSPLLDALARALTTLGYTSFLVPFLVALHFGIERQRSFRLLYAVVLTLLVTVMAKEIAELPRPFMVDRSVKLLDPAYSYVPSVELHGDHGFFALLPVDVVQETRRRAPIHAKAIEDRFPWGLPSGHSSGAVALWGGLALLYPARWIRRSFWIPLLLVPFSRMYLGVHFLADILAGLALGWFALALLECWRRWSPPEGLGWALGLVAPLVTVPWTGWKNPLTLVGILLGYRLVQPLFVDAEPVGSTAKRLLRVLLALTLYAAVSLGVKLVATQAGLPQGLVDGLRGLLSGVALTWVGWSLARRFGWFA